MASEKAAVYCIGEDEAGMRLDRWFHRRFPDSRIRISRRSCARARCGSRASGRKSRPGSTPGKTCACRRSDAASEGPAASAPIPATLEAIRAMILFEDRDVLVLNKPYGLAVQGGSGTKRHIDGMLEALADKAWRAARPRPSARPRHLGRADDRQIAQDRCRAWRDFSLPRAKKIYWALVEGVPKPAQGRISMFLAKGEGMGDERAGRAARISSGCGSPSTASPTRSIR